MVKIRENKWFQLYLLAFGLPPAILCLVYFQQGMVPFGDKTVLISDLSGQYADFYAAYYEILTQGKSLLYSWKAGMGMNFLGLFTYYLSSPFSLLILLFPKGNLTGALLLITLLKAGTAGLTFAIYSHYAFPVPLLPTPDSEFPPLPSRISTLIFSVLYALMAYFVVYSFNLMWLDGVIFLPLVLLGTEKILRENKVLFFVFSLILLFTANYYIAYMAGLFSFLYLLAGFFSKHSFREMKLFASKLFLFLFSVFLAAGCSAVLLVPAFFALLNAQSSPDLSLFHWEINFALFDLLSKTQLGAYHTIKNGGLPNIYCGLLPLLLIPLYFLNPRIPGKERILYLLLLGFLLFSFCFSNLNMLWHAFDFPNSFPYRYSFVFSFFLIFLASKSFSYLKYQDRRRLAESCTAWIVVIIILQKMNYSYLSAKLLMIGILFLVAYALLLTGWLRSPVPRPPKAIFLLILTGFILLETSLNTWFLIGGLDEEYKYVTKQDYQRTLSKIEPLLSEILAKDKSFYRLDRVGGRTYNDPLNLNYQGITHYSSLSNPEMNFFLRQLGFLSTAGYKSVNFAGSTPITESLLGIKYVISAKDKGLGYREVIDQAQMKAYQNNYALPLGFLVDKSLLEFDPAGDDNPFRSQNRLINLALGRTDPSAFQDYFLPISLTGTKLNNATIVRENGKEVIRRINPAQLGSIEYTLVNPRSQQVYVCFQTINHDVRFFLNGEEITSYLRVYNKRIIDLGYYPRNSECKIKLSFGEEGIALTGKYFYGLSAANLDKALSPLQNNVLENIQLSDTSVLGNINVRNGTKNLLFTSIPYDPGWKVLIDGREASLQKIGKAFIGLELEAGQHNLLFSYRPVGYQAGKVISGISVSVLLIFILVEGKRKKAL